MKLFRLCTPCIVIGLGLTVWTSVSMAQDGGVTITYEYVTRALFAALLVLIGAYVKGVKDTMASDIKETKTEVAEIDDLCKQIDLKIAREYPTRTDLREIIRSELEPLRTEIANLKSKPFPRQR